MEPQYLHDNDPWRLAEDIPDLDFHFSQIWLSAFVNDLEKTIGINYKKVLCVYSGYTLKFFYGTKDSEDVGRHILDLLKLDPGFGQAINDNIRRTADGLKSISAKIDAEYLQSLSNEQLKLFHQQLDAIHTEFYTWGWLPNAVDMFNNDFTTYLKSELGKKVSAEKVNEVLVNLTATKEKSIVQQEYESLLQLVAMKQDGVNEVVFKEALKKHHETYFYVKHLWVGTEGYSPEYYLQEVNRIIAEGGQGKAMLGNTEKLFQEALQKREALLRDLGFDEHIRKLFDVYAEFAVTKSYRRDAQLYWAYKMDALFKELSFRFGIDTMQTRFVLPSEIYAALDAGELSGAMKTELAERIKYCAYYGEKNFEKVYIHEEAKRLEESTIVEIDKNITEIKGQVACLGKAVGKVKIINSPADMHKMEQGDILVSIATNPDIVLAMQKAAAIVTEQGGITSHAAIVSRELNTPCVIGTKIATQVLKDGDMVEVDARAGIVKKNIE